MATGQVVTTEELERMYGQKLDTPGQPAAGPGLLESTWSGLKTGLQELPRLGKEFMSGMGGSLYQTAFGAADLMKVPQLITAATEPEQLAKAGMEGRSITTLPKPSWYETAEKGLTEQVTPAQKAGGWVGVGAQLLMPWGPEVALTKGMAAGSKALMGAKLGQTAIGGLAAEAVSSVPVAMAKVGTLELLQTQDGMKAYEAAKAMAYLDVGDPESRSKWWRWYPFRHMPGPALWGPIVKAGAAGKVFPSRVPIEPGSDIRMLNWAVRKSITEVVRESAPTWLIRGVFNTPASGYRLGRDPERAIIREFGFFEEKPLLEKARHMVPFRGEQRIPKSIMGWKMAIQKRINQYTAQVEDALKIAEGEGIGAKLDEVGATFDAVVSKDQLGGSIYPQVRKDWVEYFNGLREGVDDIGTWDDLIAAQRYKSLASMQRQKIELGEKGGWDSTKGIVDVVTKARRQVYHAMDASIDEAVERARAKLQAELTTGFTTPPVVRNQANLPLGTKAPTRPAAELENLISRLRNVGDLNDRLANLIDAKMSLEAFIKATRTDKAWFWAAQFGKAGVLGSAMGGLTRIFFAGPTALAVGGAAGLALGTPQGRALLTKGYPAMTALPYMAAGIAKSPALSYGMAAGLITDQFQEPADPDPLKLRKGPRTYSTEELMRMYGQPDTGNAAQTEVPR